jgi:hypothetical protein
VVGGTIPRVVFISVGNTNGLPLGAGPMGMGQPQQDSDACQAYTSGFLICLAYFFLVIGALVVTVNAQQIKAHFLVAVPWVVVATLVTAELGLGLRALLTCEYGPSLLFRMCPNHFDSLGRLLILMWG